MKSKPTLDCSIIIPNLHSPIIDRTIQSILAQDTEHSFEIIVVGMDKFSLVESFKDKVIFHKTDSPTPPAIARNIGAKLAKGERLLFIDADCIADSEWINYHFINPAKKEKELIVGGGVTFSTSPFLTLTDNVSTFHEYMIHIKQGKKTLLPSLNLSMPKSLWEKLEGFDESYPYASGEDSDFAIRASKLGVTLLFEPKAMISHQPQRSNLKVIMDHAFRFGEFSVKGRKDYWDTQFVPFLLKHWLLALISSPIISLAVVLKMVLVEKLPIKYWVTLPFVFIYKMCWMFGYIKQIRK